MGKKPFQANDTAWKDIMESYLKEFAELCLPDVYVLIDWEKPWISLEKELHAISKDDITGKKVVDKLFKVYLKNGDEQWVLIHLEIQDEAKDIFSKRMFIYSYRLYDKYQQAVLSCALLTDTNRLWRPDHYEVGFGGSTLRLNYRVVKLLDYQGEEAMLESSSNVFASVILSYLAAQRVKKRSDKERAQVKYDLTKRLYRKGYSKEQILKLYLYIDWVLHLSEADEIKYKEAVFELEAEQNMAYISTIESMGIKKGIQQGECSLLMRLLKHKFRTVPKNYDRKLSEGSAEDLLRWGERVLDARSLDEVFEE